MKKVLLLGAGMVARPIAKYILNNNIALTIASRTLSKAEKLTGDSKNGKAVAWTVDNIELLEQMVEQHDLVVSLLPFSHHPLVARLCIKFRKHMVTTSYVSPEMKALDSDAGKAGIIILNEIGVDPGFDHMTAMRIIDKVKSQGGEIKQFYSLCGALPAPEESNNPFRYKFSWSPRGVIMAGNNGAKFRRNNEIVELPTKDLFKNPMEIDFPGIGPMEVYPNRDSLAYMDLYGLKGLETMYRGTFRYPNWCEAMDAIKSIGMVTYDKMDFRGKTYKEVVAYQIDVYPKNVKEKVAQKLDLGLDSPAIIAMEWLGLFSDDRVTLQEGSTFDITSDLMLKKMMLPAGARDMVIMLHAFLIKNKKGKNEVIKSRLLDYATDEDTSISRTVALPAAIAVKMILDGKIANTGVQIPVIKSIYEPVLNELENHGISMIEEWGLQEKDMPDRSS